MKKNFLINKFILFEDDYYKKYLEDNFDVQKIFELIEKLFNKTKKVFTIFFCSGKTIREYNKNYRNIDKETDVLSFIFNPSNKVEKKYKKLKNLRTSFIYIGDLIVSPENILRKAYEQNEEKNELLLYMIVHSYLHLEGFSHDNEEQYKLIEKKTEKILNNLLKF
jgi:probable rRNA maturation factor